MILELVFMLIGIFILIKSADKFIEHVAELSSKIGISEFVIGLTLSAIGTSLPELASAVTAIMLDDTGLLIGNIIGSNMANIGLIVGIAAMIRPIRSSKKLYSRDGYFLLLSVLLFFFFSLDNILSKNEAIIFLLIYGSYLLFLFQTDREPKHFKFHDFISYIVEFKAVRSAKFITKPKSPVDYRVIGKHAGLALLSLTGVVFGARMLIGQSISLAGSLGLSSEFIGISIIAIGTSVPELMISIKASLQKHSSLVLGNVIGSNIANVMLIGGVSGFLKNLIIQEQTVSYAIPMVLFFTLFLLLAQRSGWEITKKRGAALVIAYAVFMLFEIRASAFI